MQKKINGIDFDLGLRAYMLFENENDCSFDEAIAKNKTYSSVFNMAYCAHKAAAIENDFQPLTFNELLSKFNKDESFLFDFMDFIKEVNGEKKAATDNY